MPTDDGVVLLDGQQRLATITILLAAMRDLARAKGGERGGDLARDIQRDFILVSDEEADYALVLGSLDKDFFERTVQTDPPEEVRSTLRSHGLIKTAQQYIKQALVEAIEGLSATDLLAYLKRLRRAISEKLKMVGIEVGSEEEAYLIFETLNDRGLRLSVYDLLLNYLMRRAANAAQRRAVRTSWDSVIESVGTRKVSSFLRFMWVSHYNDVKNQALYREIRLKLEGGETTAVDFARLCAHSSANYKTIVELNSSLLGDSIDNVKALMRNLDSERSIPLLLAGLDALEPNNFNRVVKLTIDLTIRYAVISNLDPSRLENVLYGAAKDIREMKNEGASQADIVRRVRDNFGKIDPSDAQVEANASRAILKKEAASYVVKKLAELM